MNESKRLRIGVVGAGTMGRGVVQLFAQAGHDVLCFDEKAGAAATGIAAVVDALEKLAAKGRLSEPNSRRHPQPNFDLPIPSRPRQCDVVVEAVIEDLASKRALFANLEQIVSPQAILATNTSSLGSPKSRRPVGIRTRRGTAFLQSRAVDEDRRDDRRSTHCALRRHDAARTGGGAGHKAVVVADQPGFLVNHAGRGLYTEGLRIVEECVASPADVDDVLREGLGFRMGPFELLDLTGLDVSSKVMTSIYAQFQEEPRFRPSSLVPPRVAAGLYGRKSGEGWYRYESGQKIAPLKSSPPALRAGLSFWIDPSARGLADLGALAQRAEARRVENPCERRRLFRPADRRRRNQRCCAVGVDAPRCLAVESDHAIRARRTLMLTVATAPQAREAAHALLASDGVPVTIIGDSVGFIAQRVIATIVNIAANIAQRGIAAVDDLERPQSGSGSAIPWGRWPGGSHRRSRHPRNPARPAERYWRSALPAEPLDHAPRRARRLSADARSHAIKPRLSEPARPEWRSNSSDRGNDDMSGNKNSSSTMGSSSARAPAA